MFNDIKTDRRLDDALRAELSGRGVNALMLIPLSTGMTWLGALLLEATSGQTFTGDQARLCRNIADQAALVVDSQLLLFRAQQAAEREHALRDTAAALSSTLDPDTLLGVVLDNLGRVLPHDAANLLIMDGDFARPRLIRGYAEQGIDEDIVMQFRVPIQYADNLRRMRDERQPFIIADTRTYPGWVDNEVTHWVRSYAGAPVFVGDTLLGFISLDSATPGLYTEEHSALLQTFADQAAIAIQNAQRYEETQRRIQHEQMVGEIAAELQHAHTIEAVLETAARSLQQTLGNYDVAVRLTGEPERQSLPETTEASNAN
jgi:GAF domain-containing protein